MARSKVIDRDRGFREFIRRTREKQRRAVGVKVGIQGPAAQDTGTLRKGEMTNVILGTIHEFGAPSVNIPSRSFIRSTVDKNRAKYQRELKRIEERSIKTKSAPRFDVLGEKVLADMQDRIDSNIPPPLQDSTIAARTGGKDDLALVDTGELRGSLSWAPARGDR